LRPKNPYSGWFAMAHEHGYRHHAPDAAYLGSWADPGGQDYWPPFYPQWFAAMPGAFDAFGGGFVQGIDVAADGDVPVSPGVDAGAGPHSQTYLRRQRRKKAAGLARSVGGAEAADAGHLSAGKAHPNLRSTAGAASLDRFEDDERIAQLQKALEEGGSPEIIADAIATLRGNMVRLSLQPLGCRLVQAALPHASLAVAAELVEELYGHVWELISSPHGNYVVQRTIEVLPEAQTSFIASELHGRGAAVAKHRFGCRICCRLLEHTANSEATTVLIEEMLEQCRDLTRHSYAHHVISAMLEHGLTTQQTKVLSCLEKDLVDHALNRNASYVIEKALVHLGETDRERISLALANSDELLQLAQHQFGSFVVRALLAHQSKARQRIVARLATALPDLQSTKFGLRVVEDMRKLGLVAHD